MAYLYPSYYSSQYHAKYSYGDIGVAKGLIEASRGEGLADPGRGKVVFNGIEVGIEEVGMGFLLSALAACTAKKITKELSLKEQVRVIVRGLVSLSDLIEEGEPPLRMIVVEAYIPEGADENAAEEAVYRCPGMRMIRHLIKEVIIRKGVS